MKMISNISKSSSAFKTSIGNISEGIYKRKTFKEIWTNDPGTYPIIIGIGCSLLFGASFGIYYLLKSPDVRIWGESRIKLFRGNLDDKKEK